MSRQHLDACRVCEQRIVGDDCVWRHSVSDTEADAHDLDAGECHDACCPMRCADGEVPS